MPKPRASLSLARMAKTQLEEKRRKERKGRNPTPLLTRPRVEMLTRARIRRELTPAATTLRPTSLSWLIKPRKRSAETRAIRVEMTRKRPKEVLTQPPAVTRRKSEELELMDWLLIEFEK